jgi:hypothetical protein
LACALSATTPCGAASFCLHTRWQTAIRAQVQRKRHRATAYLPGKRGKRPELSVALNAGVSLAVPCEALDAGGPLVVIVPGIVRLALVAGKLAQHRNQRRGAPSPNPSTKSGSPHHSFCWHVFCFSFSRCGSVSRCYFAAQLLGFPWGRPSLPCRKVPPFDQHRFLLATHTAYGRRHLSHELPVTLARPDPFHGSWLPY